MSRKRLFLGVIVVFALIAAGCKVVVTPTAPHTWAFLNEGARGTGYLTNGPGIPPSGRGSALLTVDANGRENVGTLYFKGQALSSITKLQYSTYQAFSGSPNEAATLQFDVDYDSTDASTAYQGRLVFIPSASAPIVPNTWQTWDTLTGPASGQWYSSASGDSSYRPITGDARQEDPPCDQTNYCTWAEIQSNYANARIRPSIGVLLVRAGGPVTTGLSVAVDDVIVGLGGVDVESDFEPGDGTITVNPSSASKLSFGFSQETPSGTGSFVSGPTGSDGSGSARLTLNATGGESLSTGVFAGTSVDRFTNLSYKTYVQPTSANAPTLQFDADFDATDTSTDYQGRVVFEPSVAGAAAVTDSTWQTWDPLTTPSGWWQTGTPIVSDATAAPACTQAVPCSWTAFKAAYPYARVRPITGQVLGLPISGRMWLKAGSGWGVYDGNVDSLTVGISSVLGGGTATYDLEP